MSMPRDIETVHGEMLEENSTIFSAQQKLYQLYHELGVGDEQARIVRWLRNRAKNQAGPWQDSVNYTIYPEWKLADAIERGEHMGEEDE